MPYGCLFCRSGSEERLIESLKARDIVDECISPKRVKVRRQDGARSFEPLFPGYVFFRTSDDSDFNKIIEMSEVYRLLTYPTGDWRLRGNDLDIAQFMFENGGVIELSKVRYEGDELRIEQGPLKKYERSIVRINRRYKVAEVRIDFCGREIKLIMGFEVE